jgi:hypothetical protein
MTVPAGGDDARWKTCLGLARDVLLLGPDGADLKLRYLQGPLHFAGEHTSLGRRGRARRQQPLMRVNKPWKRGGVAIGPSCEPDPFAYLSQSGDCGRPDVETVRKLDQFVALQQAVAALDPGVGRLRDADHLSCFVL